MKLRINRKRYQVDVPEQMPILWVLRDVLNLTGTKYGCGKGLCGSCTILLDDVAIRSCSTPVIAAEGKHLTTIEGLESYNKKLQQSWEECSVPQCGFCQPGQLMNAAGMLKENPNPSREQVQDKMYGNLCRCGTYKRIQEAIDQTINS